MCAGGYICKKYQTAPYPPTVGYNIGYGWPTLTGTCPSEWTQYNPGSGNFCYYKIAGDYFGHDEVFRRCHQLGADQTYIESSAEITFLINAGIIDRNYFTQINAHRFRYGPFGFPNNASGFTWSNGVNVNNYGLSWWPTQPDDSCGAESCFQIVPTTFSASNSVNDITCFIGDNLLTSWNGIGSCKRPMIGTRTIYVFVYYFYNFPAHFS